MFGTLLTHFSPLATIYNSLVVVKSAFKQLGIKQYSYDAIQTEQVQETFNYDPYADADRDNFITHDTENDFMMVDKLMEDVDDDFCLAYHPAVETQSGKSSAAAPLVNCGYNLASVLVKNLANSFICGAVLSCNFVWTRKKSLEDFVQENSEKIANAPIVRSVSAPAQPKMRGFATDFGDDVPGIKFGLSKSTENHHSHHVDTKHYGNDVKPKRIDVKPQKIDVTANIRFAQELFGVAPLSKLARRNQARFKDEDEFVEDWGLVKKDYTVGSNASCNL